jgi:transcriptional regulator with XRE-family HTH domain
MGRKKLTPPPEVANPLQRMLGTYLRLERLRLGRSTEEIATKLGLTDTFLRLTESGRAALNHSLIFRIIEIYADTGSPTHETRSISFHRLAIYMVGTHWLGAEMARLGDSPNADQRAFETLALNVRDFGKLYERVRDYFGYEDSVEQRDFVERVAVPEVGRFLTTENYYTKDFEKTYSTGHEDEVVPLSDLIELPTLNVDIILDLKRQLTGRSFVHTPDVAAKWESDRASNFKCVKGVFENADLVVSEANLQRFRYRFLAEPNFRELQMIFVKARTNETGKTLTRDFANWLDWLRDDKALQREVMKKVSFRVLTSAERRAHSETLTKLRLGGPAHPLGVPYDAFWSFETHAGLPISFIGWLDNKHADNTRNLDLRSAREKSRQFDELWKELHAGNKR